MALEVSLREVCDGLRSNRLTDRKKCAETLKEYLVRNAVPLMLTENTLQKKGYTWSDIFVDIHEYVLKEMDKYETSKTFDTVIGPLCTSLLHLCVAGSNKGSAYIKCEKIIEACLYILKDKRILKAIGDAYLTLLYKDVLPYDYYLGFITPSMWEELIDISLTACLKNYSKLDNFTKLRLLSLIVKSATSNCQIVIPLRDSLSKFQSCFMKVAYDKKAQEVIAEIIILLLEKLSTECRLTMCLFVESMLSTVLKFYDQNNDQKKKAYLFKLLYEAVVIHHPNGKIQGEDGSLAHDWDVWNRRLNGILEVVCLEAAYLQKGHKSNYLTLNTYLYYFSLTASVYYQIFKQLQKHSDPEECSSKRPKTAFNNNRTFGDLIEEFKHNHIPWMGVINMFVKSHGQCVSFKEYLSIINVLDALILNNSCDMTWDIVSELTCIVLQRVLSDSSFNDDDHKHALISLWDTCVRNSTAVSAGHTSLHKVMQCLLLLDVPNFQMAQPLIKLYSEKSMPVSDNSVTTLCILMYKFYNKCSTSEFRINCYMWVSSDIKNLNHRNTEELMLRFLASENINYVSESRVKTVINPTYDTLYNSVEECILFSEFEYEIQPNETIVSNTDDHLEIDKQLQDKIQELIVCHNSGYIKKMGSTHIDILEYQKFLHFTFLYVDNVVKYACEPEEEFKNNKIYNLLISGLKYMYRRLKDILGTDVQIPAKIKLLQAVEDLMMTDFHSLLKAEMRLCIDSDFFHRLNSIINIEPDTIDEIMSDGDEEDMTVNHLKYHCIYVLAAFCRTPGDFRSEILDLILDMKIYHLPSDFRCVLKCLELLTDPKVQQPPIGPIFSLMAKLCKALYRDSEASFGILKVLAKTLNLIWLQDETMKQNCYIMVKGYLQRCESLFYPPHVVSLIYECGAKMVELNSKENKTIDDIFQDSILNKLKGNIHVIRLYCSHLLKFLFTNDVSDEHLNEFFKSLSDIFLIEVAETNEEILKDESANRTLTIMHCYETLVHFKKPLLLQVVMKILTLQRDKSLDERLVKKVLNKLVHSIYNMDVATYLNNNVLSVLYSWFSSKRNIEDLPLYLFECDRLEALYERHKKWLIAAYSLWIKQGNISDIISLGSPITNLEDTVENCFCNIIALCLPFMVIDKYKLDCSRELPNAFKCGSGNANKMFQQTGKILSSDKWTNIFVENVGELLLLTTMHLCDYNGTKKIFNIEIGQDTKTYYYPERVYCAILNYIGELTDGNIMQYLCENQTLIVYQMILRLWENVMNENILELKALAFHAYITVLKNIPLEKISDVFICNFACQSVLAALKKCGSHKEMIILNAGFKVIIDIFLPGKSDIIEKSLPEMLSVIDLKKEEGFEEECTQLQAFLVGNINTCLKKSEDVIDFVNTMSQGESELLQCATISAVTDKLKTFKRSLLSPSYKTLLKLKQFLKCNKDHIHALCDIIDPQGFSEVCKTSIIHQIISLLNQILTSSQNEKIITEACNCLSEVGTYDLKTLVTVPPPETDNVVAVNPKNYFVVVAVKSLVDIIFDKDTQIAGGALETLHSLLRYVDDVDALELEVREAQVLKSLTSPNNNLLPIEIDFNIKAFDEYCASCSEGVFTEALVKRPACNNNDSHYEWLKIVTTTLLKVLDTRSDYVKSLLLVCKSKPGTCKNILPALIGLLLHILPEKYIEIISQQINTFFNYIWDKSFKENMENDGEYVVSPKTIGELDICNRKTIKYMLAAIDFVRLQKKHYKSRPNKKFEAYNYLKLEYDKVAWAATVADQNLTAVYYGELWAIAQNNGVPPNSPEITTSLNGGERIQKIFRKCYVSIGDMDAIEGCGTAHLTMEEEKRKHLIWTGQFADALLLHDVAPGGARASPRLALGVVTALRRAGMHRLALHYIHSLPDKHHFNDTKYQCLAYLGDWSELVDTKELEIKGSQPNCNPDSLFKAYRYVCLKDCLTAQNSPALEGKIIQLLNKSKQAVHRLCQTLNMENCQNLYKVVGKLHLLTDIEDFLAVKMEKSSIKEILNKWEIRNLPNYKDFKHLESLISQRVLILEHAAKSCNDSFNEISSLQIQYAKLGLSNNRIQMAERLLAVVKKLKASEEVTLVESEISWAKGHKDIAISLLRNMACNQTTNNKINAISLRRFGLWMADTKRDNTSDIISRYLLRSLEILKNDDHEETRLKVYYVIAKFADAEYKQVVKYMNSSIFENKVKCWESMKGTASSLRSTQQSLTRDEKKAYFVNDRFRELDEAEIANTKAEKESYLQLAMRYYLLSLKQCEENNLSIFRVISLWLDNPCFEFEEGEATFSDMLHSIPSRKFITVLPQIAPRLTNQTTEFAANLKSIIKRCAQEHPHHTLPILFSLKNSDKDKIILNASSNARKNASKVRQQEPRVLAAETVVNELARENSQLSGIISQMEKMCDATISFANYKPTVKDVKQKVPSAEKIHKLGKLDKILVPTMSIPIRSECRYHDFPTIYSFESSFELVGGINCPKKLSCMDSHGNKRILLVKGEDDMRQDAVMQQVFNIVNTLLEKDPVTSRNKLLIRTYKVVPMSRQSGVLEWCVGTIPLGMYLVGVGNSGAHARYRPQDISCHAARKKMTECHETRKSNKEKLQVFMKILKEFKPVFHYFFTENYLNPVTWYERRLAYIKSVSTSSMVGYILGLGDRHVQNILIDKRTAEVIHIDFGIAFDQGKTLHTPETVPFRLTQDMIAGFGASGIEGIFRRCCEKTMQLLRNNQETLLTILEVLLCDPLYTWTVTTAHQNGPSVNPGSGSNSGLAERSLLSVCSKLSGAEGGAGGVGVAGQVARLLQTATDPANLCRLFPGWQPYL